MTAAEKEAESVLIRDIKAAEAARRAAEQRSEQEAFTTVRRAEAQREAADRHAQELLVTAEAEQSAAAKHAVAKKVLAEAITAETAAPGLAETQVLEARAAATAKQGGAEAEVLQLKAEAEAEGITKKAAAMKLFDGVGREHEEFKLRLNKEKEIDLAQIRARTDIASSQAHVLGEALKNAKIDIVGGETQFFDRITNAISGGKAVDRLMQNSETLTDVKDSFFNGDPEYFHAHVRGFVVRFGLTSVDVKKLSFAG
ncbi:MAG: flotillin family protein, partial [Verrucomicrobiota bacterium]|nr:flotillin family protein [Verrucomicrobiota bacterium]